MSASQFPGFVFKEKGLLCQRVNYQLLALSNETDANSQTSGKKLGLKLYCCRPNTALFALIFSAFCPRRGHAQDCTWGSSSQLGTQWGSPPWQCHPSKGDTGVIAISWTPQSLHRETPLILSQVNPGLYWTVQASGSGAAGACFSQARHHLLGLPVTRWDSCNWAVWGSVRLLRHPVACLMCSNASQLTYLCFWGRPHGVLGHCLHDTSEYLRYLKFLFPYQTWLKPAKIN